MVNVFLPMMKKVIFFFSSKGDLDLLRDFRFGLFDGDRDKISGDFCEFDRERDLIATFGDAEGE